MSLGMIGVCVESLRIRIREEKQGPLMVKGDRTKTVEIYLGI